MVMPDPLTKIDTFIKEVDVSSIKDKDLKKILQHLKKTYKKVAQTTGHTSSQWITR